MSTTSNPFVNSSGAKPTCMEMLQIILDGEATDDQQKYFKTHMDHCMPCYKSYDLDMHIKKLLQSKCCGGECPEELIEKIKVQITQSTSL
jgi:mycothiol system anti-sigma-R factor